MLGPGDRRRDLQQKGRLADAGIAAQQQHGATHQPAAGHAIKFGYARGCPRSILRLATYELMAEPEVPVAVIIDEAVELAKQYSTEFSGGFVNGVLATIARQVRN